MAANCEVFHFGHNSESYGWLREQLIHFGSKLQSVEECPTEAHLEHVKFPQQAVCLYPGRADLDPYTQNTLYPGVPPPTTESTKGGSVPVIWRKPGTALTWSTTRIYHSSIRARIQWVNPPPSAALTL
ncbi:hypothetical protein TNCV_1962821 [Trichonephila clavipes]|nr:hypothetical protein TNCV_1962821 [Trichonephila clavipes]